MTFSQAVSRFATSLPGTDAYSKLKQDMQNLIKQDPLACSAYFLISGFARTYVMLYEDQEIRPEFAEQSKQELLGYLQRLETALESGEKALLLDAMNKVVSDYNDGNKIF